ncbi:MAG: carotenoid biosynthesis protein [Winogradskyella sp.]|uniref:carotenoid biosynthesis protein n=1 Tax=Winogradskyella sp. TaxID=1883156 RepID=UPI000F4086AD|nr:carotenoid biosynthesis protein [Winogradskyella sp.]RNC80179.1 MAG: carotenoid biosynthesis protein [Winogradskyella sp.]
MIDSKFIKYFSIFLVWLFTISGIFGILSEGYSDWFLSMTSINLLLLFVIVIINIKSFKPIYSIAFSIPFFIGFITEALGVNFGLIFGSYTYGENLGLKVVGVPVMICLNWALLTAITSDVASCFSKNRVLKASIGALLMTLLDGAIEISAPRFDFWEFDGGVVPVQNYVGWFIVAFIAHMIYQQFKVKTDKQVSWHILTSMVIFFITFLIF